MIPPSVRASVALLFAFPFAAAHVAPHQAMDGLPKTYCESAPDMLTHDYSDWQGRDINNRGSRLGLPADGALACHGLPGDGHAEWAFGGAWLLADPRAEECWGALADHDHHRTIVVVDEVRVFLQGYTPFFVFADTLNNVPSVWPDCGDFESDFHMACIDSCWVPFHPGLDGSYQVYVNGGVRGHVWTAP